MRRRSTERLGPARAMADWTYGPAHGGSCRTGRVRPFRIGSRAVGPGHPVLVIAEAGVNHDGDEEKACRLVRAAARARADVVKFQMFDPDGLASARAPKAAYQRAGGPVRELQRDMLRRLALPREAYARLKRHVEDLGMIFLVSPFDAACADFLEEAGVLAFKVPSGELTNAGFLAHLARKGRPLIVSTGMSGMRDVVAAVRTIRSNGKAPLCLLHCVSRYPATPEECNLRAMETMRERFGVPVGWSDHTLGTSVALAAVALGASVVEKHLTLDRTLPGPDHRSSLEPEELAGLVRAIREVEAALGSGRKRPAPSESTIAAVARRSVHAARDLPSGHRIVPGDLVALRPGTGIPADSIGSLRGRRLTRTVPSGRMIRKEDLA